MICLIGYRRGELRIHPCSPYGVQLFVERGGFTQSSGSDARSPTQCRAGCLRLLDSLLQPGRDLLVALAVKLERLNPPLSRNPLKFLPIELLDPAAFRPRRDLVTSARTFQEIFARIGFRMPSVCLRLLPALFAAAVSGGHAIGKIRQETLAKRLKVSRPTIGRIVRKQAWKHF
jgi:hypothetical protein